MTPSFEANSAPPTSACAQRLLDALHPVCSHDLPNQVVGLQSLLQLFQWDEAEHLTPQGQEYFGRMQSIADKTFALVQYLKELVRLHRHGVQREKLVFATLAEELQAEMRRALPEHVCTWECHWPIDSAMADRRLVYHGVMHLLRGMLAGKRTMTSLRMHTTMKDEHVAWTIEAAPQGAASPASARSDAPTRGDATSLAEHLEFALAQENLAATEIACRPTPNAPAGVSAFLLLIPARTAHD